MSALTDRMRGRVVVVDNYNSFTFNLVQYLAELGADTVVVRNDALDSADVVAAEPSAIVLSPGPGRPEAAGICVDLVRDAARRSVPLLGVCLGHQAIALAFGGRVVNAAQIMHGKRSDIEHSGDGIFAGLPNPLPATRYHSLIVERSTLPAPLLLTAWTADGTVMGLQHRHQPVHGVQFHPEVDRHAARPRSSRQHAGGRTARTLADAGAMKDLGALAPIVERKRLEAAALHCGRAAMFAHAANREHAPDIDRILAGGTVVAEIKRRSPSAGTLRPDLDPTALASAYEAAGAAAISVLTDGPDFGGSLDDLVAVRAAVEIPVLRKDFVVAPVQIAEARVAGADWVLLIAALFDDAGLDEAIDAARRCGAGALVEVHDDGDLDRALAAGAQCIGINSRDLRTLTTDAATFERLRVRIPAGVVTVAEVRRT